MDPIIHGYISAVVGSRRSGWSIRRIWPYMFWGMIPDLYQIIFLSLSFVDITYFNNFYQQNFWTWYNPSHSLISALAVFLVVSLIRRRWCWPLTMWVLHVLFDIISHQFHKTPFLWPVSDFKIMGWFDYTRPSSLLVTYAVAIIVGLIFIWRRKRLSSVRLV